MLRTIFILSFIFAAVCVNAQFKADDVLGTWITSEGRAKVLVYKSGTKYFGKIIWLKDPNKNGKPRMDVKNQNAALRNKPIIDLVILKDFEFDDGEWVNGKVYEPSGGKEYSSKITMPNIHTLKVRGYVGISLFGKTDVWKRS